ncbi:M28 family peptidase [Defluviitalea raffinosedens]|jgi:aminopeptidase YwaD|uniref:M28 family peptidase n=1 Tax=Defluviitalea raffinosedens TaxID=1450156 RepID=A0A7C8LJP3_9FIRM|nr:M28 family peptidase [Defluviitalea raffinosedens]KAE9630692.1 M28 family peptidase [Defluviitalea raffinosedens]MBM7686300.1 aminopeptidase YwaD [Defluviitalea raffinosedens]MBZ4668488.1 peptidase [Defluviitaleaceae bacterium]
MELLAKIAKTRPVGTAQNQEITDYIHSYLQSLGYTTKKVPFSCKVWESNESFLVVEGNKIVLQASPFSEPFTGTRKAIVVRNLEELERAECVDKILFLTEDLAKESLQPKDYPFYYPDEHKAIIDCLEAKKPDAIIAITGETNMSGLKPFPLIEDGNFHIPVANLDKEIFAGIEDKVIGHEIELSIVSNNNIATAYQLIASKTVANPKGTILICAHMDSKYNTDGALDNASGVAAMLHAAKNIENDSYNIDIVPFNSEEYYDPQGELIYLKELEESRKEISLVINIDTLAHVGSQVAVATFNFSEKEQAELDSTLNSCTNIVPGQPWYAGDHAMFAFGGTKCILISASDLFEECLSYTHCPQDTIDLVDEKLIENAAEYICKVVNGYK